MYYYYRGRFPKIPGVYLVVSHLDGVHYVGGTTDYYQRWINHRSQIRTSSHWLNQYFFSAFESGKLSFFLLEKLRKNCSQKYLDKREQFWMDKFPNRINKSKFVTTKGVGPTKEVRKRISKALKGRPGHKQTPETRAKISQGQENRVYSPETRKKMSESAKKRKASSETRAKMSLAHMGNQAARGNRFKQTPKALENQRKAREARKAKSKRKLLVP